MTHKNMTLQQVTKYLFVLFSVFMISQPIKAATSSTDVNNKASSTELTYEHRDLWFELPQEEMEIGDETYLLTIQAAKNNKHRLYIWVGEPAWPNSGDALAISQLSEQGHVWYLDTPEALFIERTRINMRSQDGTFIKDLVSHAAQSFSEIIVVTADVASVPVLRGLRSWQETASNTERQQLKNVVLLYPSLFVNAPMAGEVPELFPISYQSALPITILQPSNGSQANTIDLSAKALKMGGSLVQTIDVPIATDGYFKYQDIRPMAADAAQRIHETTEQKIQRVNQIKYQVARLEPIEIDAPESKIVSGMIKLPEPKAMQSIALPALNGDMIKVPEDYKGKALLVNFWATWCPHCVEEIPSMNRALAQLDADRFAMISISYKDTQKIMQDFVKEVQVDFPILMDYDGKVSESWNVFAFPSSFLIDANGVIHYSINAGSIWDSPEMLDYLKEVMAIPYKGE